VVSPWNPYARMSNPRRSPVHNEQVQKSEEVEIAILDRARWPCPGTLMVVALGAAYGSRLA
jgi:hypothetical protein